MSPTRDHQGIVIDKFNGLWSRGDKDTTPIDHFYDCNNIDYIAQSSFGTRPGIDISQDIAVPLQNVRRIYNYPTQDANTLIVLTVTSGVGKIYHVVDAVTVYGPILTISGMEDFAFIPYAGRGYISPFATQRQGVAAPSPLTAAVVQGLGIDPGNHNYAVSYLTASGETLPSTLTTVTTLAAISNPILVPTVSHIGGIGGNSLVAGGVYKWLVTFTRGGLETAAGPASIGFAPASVADKLGLQVDSLPPAGPTGVNIYRTVANGSTFYLEQSVFPVNLFLNGSLTFLNTGFVSDAAIVGNPTAPVANTTEEDKVNLSVIPTGGATITGRNIYRTKANDTQLKLLTTINDNVTTTFTDTTPDASLGVNAPTTNTAIAGKTLIESGLSGEFLYVYAGDGTAARKAAGSGLSGSMTVANGAAGHTDAGQHIFGFVSQTISGYNAPPTILTSFITAAGSSVSFGSIPTSGDPHVVKRLLVATKVIPPGTFNGNLSGYQFFFVPGAVINDNTTAALNNVSFYDADLLADASALLENYTAIPAGAVLTLYHNRLCLAATNTDISLMLVSQPGEPEAINQITGLIVAPLDGNPISNAQEMRDILYVFKRSRTLSYTDNQGDPSSWPLIVIDSALGTAVHGIATVLDSGSSSVDYLIVCTYQGVSQFNGRYIDPELSWKVENFWKGLNRDGFGSIQIINSPTRHSLYIVLPTKQLLVANYANGMDWKNIRWSPWSFLMTVNTVAVVNVDEIIVGADLVA